MNSDLPDTKSPVLNHESHTVAEMGGQPLIQLSNTDVQILEGRSFYLEQMLISHAGSMRPF
jgi:hypothetical protein